MTPPGRQRQRTTLMRDAEFHLTQAIRCFDGLARVTYGDWEKALADCQEARSIARERRKQEMAA